MEMTSWPAVQPGPAAELSVDDSASRVAPPVMPGTSSVDAERGQRPVPRPRTATDEPAADGARPGLDITAVLPYAGSAASKRTRSLRAWMVTAPVDLAALLAPLLLTDRYWRGTLFAAGLTVTMFAAGGLYRGRRHLSILDELPTLCGRLLASAGIVAAIAAMRHGSVEYVEGFMRGVVFSAGLVLLGRAVTRRAVVFARRRRWVEHNTIVLGSGPISVELARLLRRNPRYGLRFVGCVDSRHRSGPGSAPVIGKLEDLEDRIMLTECDVLIIGDPDCPEPALMELLSRPASAGCDLWAVQRLWGSRSPAECPTTSARSPSCRSVTPRCPGHAGW